MSTIASPRPSVASSSRRNSTSTDVTTLSTSTTTAPTRAPGATDRTSRRNRTALRDYYNLKLHVPILPTSPSTTSPATATATAPISELDLPDFDPQAYVSGLLAGSGSGSGSGDGDGDGDGERGGGVEGLLRIEAGLVSEMRTLDGERKALVYDNYSKLIAATRTIRSMREKMDPLTPATRTLGPAVERIAGLAAERRGDLRGYLVGEGKGKGEREREKEMVRWVLGAPERLRGLVAEGEVGAAKTDWEEVEGCLERWEGVKGTEEVKRGCLEALEGVEE